MAYFSGNLPLRNSLKQTIHVFWRLLPLLTGVLLLAAMVAQLIPQLMKMGFFGHGAWSDALAASGIASIATGQPVVSYILAGELQKAGVELLAVTAFITAWITVGVVSLPVEAQMLGLRFALWRNLVAFVFSLLIAWLTVALLHAF
ncbi:hypothetical protein [Thiolapillus brandeum]|uniref:Permease n=1 Tax=Thiolapillus brandeum TaxID=1076588 RepID=A0A7U6GJR5_9GAMM|nr:hypothetical protein [Thiolapillus brandeum]BAO44906.1 conserved hypothetical protein [Thiolapillus brandeum]